MFRRFWFTRYGTVGHGKHILFRFETDDLPAIEPYITALQASFSPGRDGYTDYDYAGDLGRGEQSRLLGDNIRHQDPARRGDIAFDFLHASARLLLDCLTGPDADGYFQLEPETSSGFSVETSLEQFHHLFCNMTCVPTYMVIAAHPNHPDGEVMSWEDFKKVSNNDHRWQVVQRGRINF